MYKDDPVRSSNLGAVLRDNLREGCFPGDFSIGQNRIETLLIQIMEDDGMPRSLQVP
jgi:hypothetical protein